MNKILLKLVVFLVFLFIKHCRSDKNFLPEVVDNSITLSFLEDVATNLLSQVYELNDISEEISNESVDELDSPGNYSMYLFVVGWGDSTCFSRKKSKYCYYKLNNIESKNVFTIHGLWPNKSKSQSNVCNTGKTIYVNFDDNPTYKKKMDNLWPSLMNDNEHFWTHEFNKHGMCYNSKTKNTGYQNFFNVVLELYNRFKISELGSFLKKYLNKSDSKYIEMSYESLEKIVGDYLDGKNFEFTCIKYKNIFYLQDIRIYLDLDFKNMDGYRFYTNCSKKKLIRLNFN